MAVFGRWWLYGNGFHRSVLRIETAREMSISSIGIWSCDLALPDSHVGSSSPWSRDVVQTDAYHHESQFIGAPHLWAFDWIAAPIRVSNPCGRCTIARYTAGCE